MDYSYPEFKTKINEFSSPDSPEMKIIEAQGYYNRGGVEVGQTVDIPDCLDTILSKYFDLTIEAKDAFMSACILFCNGIDIWQEAKSLSFTAFVSSIETLIAYDCRGEKVERCPECNQEVYKVGQRFKDFLRQYASQDPKIRKFANKLYAYRCAILHRGELLLSDLNNPFIHTKSHIEEDMLHRGLILTTRICLVNWLLKH